MKGDEEDEGERALMTSAEGNAWPHDLADADEDAAPQIRRFLEAIARSKAPARPATAPAPASPVTPLVDRERQVMRFAWACEELNVAFGAIDVADHETMKLLVDHGVGLTLEEVQAKAAAFSDAIDRASRAPH